jgi:1-acyl-sn-glycerol-3-phosphate acyltransferase
MSDSIKDIPQVIDVDKIFKDKNPGLYKWLPGFLLAFIKRVIHQNEMNAILHKSGDARGVDFANIVLQEMGVNVRCKGLENIPESGPIIIVANHPLGGLDAMALISFIGKKRKDIRYLVNDILTRLPNFGEIFVPVNKLGTNAKSNLERIEHIYASDAAVIVFPAGLCSRKVNGIIQDLEWQKSFVSKAQKYKHPIIPVLIKAQNSHWFYNLSRFRTKLGIKANIEMFYLPDEMFKQKGKTIELIIGKPIDSQSLDSPKSAKSLALKIKEFVYQLDKYPEKHFKG